MTSEMACRVREFEAAFASHFGFPHALRCHCLALRSLLRRWARGGDEVIVRAHLHVTVEAVLQVGAIPVVDIDESLNINPTVAEQAITSHIGHSSRRHDG